jgi:hypothetical protein
MYCTGPQYNTALLAKEASKRNKAKESREILVILQRKLRSSISKNSDLIYQELKLHAYIVERKLF